MNQITREQAFDLAKYRYKLVDKDGNVLTILAIYEVGEFKMNIYSDELKLDDYVDWSQIGTDYLILCRDLSQLTETIEHEGENFVPIEHFEIGDENSYEYEFDNGNIKLISGLKYISEYNIQNDINYLPFPVTNQLQYWHFNLGFPQETVKLIINGSK